jgi:hypothetical protein
MYKQYKKKVENIWRKYLTFSLFCRKIKSNERENPNEKNEII